MEQEKEQDAGDVSGAEATERGSVEKDGGAVIYSGMAGLTRVPGVAADAARDKSRKPFIEEL